MDGWMGHAKNQGMDGGVDVQNGYSGCSRWMGGWIDDAQNK